MKIRCTNPGTHMLYVSEYMAEPVRFKNGLATVSEAVGMKMVKEFGSIEEVKPTKAKKKVEYKEGE